MKKFLSLKDLKFVQSGINKKLGEGSYATVKLAKHIDDEDTFYAVKQLDKLNEKEIEYIQEEIELHKNLSHQNIIKYVDSVEDENHVYIILEYAQNGDLFKTFKNKNLNDHQLLKIFYETCLGIQYLHQKDIMHRDLKPENILLGKNYQAKICDFGWSCQWSIDRNRQSLCGTFEYVAPEIFDGKNQTKATDIWSLGILMYELFLKGTPFKNITLKNYKDLFQKGVFYPSYLNPKIIKLLKKIFLIEPQSRLNIEQIINDELFKELNNKDFSCKLTTDQQFANAIKQMNKKYNFKKKKQESKIQKQQQNAYLNLHQQKIESFEKQVNQDKINNQLHTSDIFRLDTNKQKAIQYIKPVHFQSQRQIPIIQKKKKYSLLQSKNNINDIYNQQKNQNNLASNINNKKQSLFSKINTQSNSNQNMNKFKSLSFQVPYRKFNFNNISQQQKVDQKPIKQQSQKELAEIFQNQQLQRQNNKNKYLQSRGFINLYNRQNLLEKSEKIQTNFKQNMKQFLFDKKENRQSKPQQKIVITAQNTLISDLEILK